MTPPRIHPADVAGVLILFAALVAFLNLTP